jgi:uncharacterized protein (TIGR03437 family)
MFASNIATAIYTASDASPAQLPTSLGGVSATMTDASGKSFPIGLTAVTPTQANGVLPEGLNVTPNPNVLPIVNLTTSNGSHLCGIAYGLNTVAPSLFTADDSGQWLPAAQVIITHQNGAQTVIPSVAQYTATLTYNGTTWSHYIPVPVNLGGPTDTAVLILFGTGMRHVTEFNASLCSTSSTNPTGPCQLVGVDPLEFSNGSFSILYAGAQGLGEPGSFYGLDQVNVLMPYSLAGSGIVTFSISMPSYCSIGCALSPWQAVESKPVSILIQ